MGGKASRDKGGRSERLLRDQLRILGYEANRVPLSGAAQGFKGDVVATGFGKQIIFEVKSRKCSFTSLYELLGSNQSVGVQLLTGECACIGYRLENVLRGEVHYTPLGLPRTRKKIATMKQLLGIAQILAVKDDHKSFIFIRFI